MPGPACQSFGRLIGRDQPDNAARVVYAGAGTRLRGKASADALRAAAGRVMGDPAIAPPPGGWRAGWPPNAMTTRRR
jgi:hypothetical protein